jgi:purine-binding chemotaxis protein CheW
MVAALQCLLCQVDSSYLALPITQVSEVTRPLSVTRLPDAPSWVIGVCILRGEVTPVVDVRRLLAGTAADGGESVPAAPLVGRGRWVVLRIDDRRVVLAVDTVLRAHSLPADASRDVPPLVAATPIFSALGTLDSKLLMVLESARLLASDAFAHVEGYASGH